MPTEGGVKPVPSPSIVYTCSHTSIVKGTVYTETVVLTGMEPGTKYSIAVKAAISMALSWVTHAITSF